MDIGIFDTIDDKIATLDEDEYLEIEFAFRRNFPEKRIRLSNKRKMNQISYDPQSGIIELKFQMNGSLFTQFFSQNDVIFIEIRREQIKRNWMVSQYPAFPME